MLERPAMPFLLSIIESETPMWPAHGNRGLWWPPNTKWQTTVSQNETRHHFLEICTSFQGPCWLRPWVELQWEVHAKGLSVIFLILKNGDIHLRSQLNCKNEIGQGWLETGRIGSSSMFLHSFYFVSMDIKCECRSSYSTCFHLDSNSLKVF